MTHISQEVPKTPLSLSQTENADRKDNTRSAKKVKEEIFDLEEEVKRRRNLIAVSTKTSRQNSSYGIDLNRLVTNGSGKAIADARKKIEDLNKELEVINSTAVEKVTE